MFNIAEYLSKFKNIGQSDKLLKEEISLLIKEITGIEIEGKNISIRNAEIFIKTSPAIKSVIFIKKEVIIKQLQERKIKITNVR